MGAKSINVLRRRLWDVYVVHGENLAEELRVAVERAKEQCGVIISVPRAAVEALLDFADNEGTGGAHSVEYLRARLRGTCCADPAYAHALTAERDDGKTDMTIKCRNCGHERILRGCYPLTVSGFGNMLADEDPVMLKFRFEMNEPK